MPDAIRVPLYTEDLVREDLQVYSHIEDAPAGSVLLGDDSFFFAIEKEVFQDIRIEPNTRGRITREQVQKALDAYLKLSVDLCWRLSKVETAIRDIEEYKSKREIGADCQPEDEDSKKNLAAPNVDSQRNTEEDDTVPRIATLCDFLKQVREALQEYLRLSERESQNLANAAKNLYAADSTIWNPSAPIIL